MTSLAQPIAIAPQDGTIIAFDGENVAVARWASGMWCYDVAGFVEQLDFEPDRWFEPGSSWPTELGLQ